MKPPLKQIRFLLGKYGRGRRIRTLTGGFGDRCATIDTIPLKTITLLLYTRFKNNASNFLKYYF